MIPGRNGMNIMKNKTGIPKDLATCKIKSEKKKEMELFSLNCKVLHLIWDKKL